MERSSYALVVLAISVIFLAPGCSRSSEKSDMSYICATCGEKHDDLPSIGAHEPYQWSAEYEKDTNSLLTDDLCVIEGRDYFVRGVIHIPIRDHDETFDWGVWVSHKKENFELYRKHFDDGVQIGPFFGWLSTRLDYYSEDTINIKTMVHYRTNGHRPWIELEPTDHPLAVHQRDGITISQAWEIVHFYDQK